MKFFCLSEQKKERTYGILKTQVQETGISVQGY